MLRTVANWAASIRYLALRAFNKFNNDWTMNLVAMVSFNVLTSFLPLMLALVTLLAFLPTLAGTRAAVAAQIDKLLPSSVSHQINIDSWISAVNGRSLVLSVVSIVGLLWGGSNLFGSIESAFAVIFRVKTRDIIPQKLMALVMILLFAVLLPLSFIASFFLSAATTTLGKIIPGILSGWGAIAIGLGTSYLSLFVLFTTIYAVVPNVPMHWRHVWRGAVVAAFAVVAVNTLFPFYISYFVNTKDYGAAALVGVLATIIWFWFFSLALLVGAQVNALSMDLGPWRHDLTRMLMEHQFPTVDGKATALDALWSEEHGKTIESPIGLVRDSHVVPGGSGTGRSRNKLAGADQAPPCEAQDTQARDDTSTLKI